MPRSYLGSKVLHRNRNRWIAAAAVSVCLIVTPGLSQAQPPTTTPTTPPPTSTTTAPGAAPDGQPAPPEESIPFDARISPTPEVSPAETDAPVLPRTPVEPPADPPVPAPAPDAGPSSPALPPDPLPAEPQAVEPVEPENDELSSKTAEPDPDWTPTENPNATVQPGTMRSDREEIPAPFTKADADKAETLEAKTRSQRSQRAALAPGCQVYWPSPHEVCGAIRDKYNALGGPGSFLSFPNSPELTNPGNTGKRTQFLNGPIYWSSATGAHPVVNSFLNRWGVHGYETGWLKYPTTDEIVLPDGGRRQEFQGGVIYVAFQNAVGSAIRNGPLRDKYNSVGGLAPGGTLLGYPTEDQKGLPDGQGQMGRFQNGVIYWQQNHGAHVVSGTILQKWADAGYETGTYGYPTADPVQTSGIWYEQQFQRGKIAGTIVLNRDLYAPLKTVEDGRTLLGENYESDVLPCLSYDIPGTRKLATFKIRGISTDIVLYCERFRTHMSPNPAVGLPGHFTNYPPSRYEWYNFLACAFYTFDGEFFDADAPNFGRQRHNIRSGISSVAIGNENNGTFVTGWAGLNANSSQWAGCMDGLEPLWT